MENYKQKPIFINLGFFGVFEPLYKIYLAKCTCRWSQICNYQWNHSIWQFVHIVKYLQNIYFFYSDTSKNKLEYEKENSS